MTTLQVIRILIATRICLIVSDLIVVAVTWYNTHDFMHPIQSHVKHSLAKLLTRDGTLYFLLLLMINIIHIILFTLNVFQDFAGFTAPISSILMSRFLLNIRQIRYKLNSQCLSASQSCCCHTSQPQLLPTSVRFTTGFVGDAGYAFTDDWCLCSTTSSHNDLGTKGDTLRGEHCCQTDSDIANEKDDLE
ncbi:hypothetical protein AcV5_003188 [Taiwanofungus camphoratus]|nr:hypothetical protein AcV5_003188 [Antrodia cinnamomea]